MFGSATTTVELDIEQPNETKDDCGVEDLENYEASIVIAAHIESKKLERAA